MLKFLFTFTNNEFLQLLYMNISNVSRFFPIVAGNRVNNALMLYRHKFISGKIIIVKVSETKSQFLHRSADLQQSLVAAAGYNISVELGKQPCFICFL